MEPFFTTTGKIECPDYRWIRDSIDESASRAHKLIDQMWAACSKFLDTDAAIRARLELKPVFWELYLAYVLHRSGKRLVVQDRKNGAPDLKTESPEVWVEAVTVGMGSGGDGLKAPILGNVYSEPVEQILLRLTSAIDEKDRKLRGYIEKGIIQKGQATIIAISGIKFDPYYSIGGLHPHIVSAVLPIGDVVVEIDRETRLQTGSTWG